MNTILKCIEKVSDFFSPCLPPQFIDFGKLYASYL